MQGDAPLICVFQQHTRKIAHSDVASLFAGYRSTAKSGGVVTKVMHHDDESTTRVFSSYMRELAVSQRLDHVSLYTFPSPSIF